MPSLIFFFILITCLLVIVLISYGEILSWSLIRVQGLIQLLDKLNISTPVESDYLLQYLCISIHPVIKFPQVHWNYLA